MAYYIGQFFGILVLVCTLVGNQLPKKWMMITVALFTNVFAGLNVLLLGQIGGTHISAAKVYGKINHCLKAVSGLC